MTPQRSVSVFFCLLLARSAGAASLDVAMPRIAVTRSEPRSEALLRKLVPYLVRALPPGEFPNETEPAIRPLAGTALSCAVCLRFAACEQPAEVRATVTRILTDLTRTHTSAGGRTASGRPWGHHWQSALWAWEAGFGAWLLWPDLPEPLRKAVIAMVVDEADRFVDLPPPYSEFLDTKAEENAWNSTILVLASEILPHHPHRAQWRERALEYMISAFATRADRASRKLVDGRPLRDWVKGVNAHSDFTVENHGFVHPDYMTTITINITNALVYRLLERPVPEAALQNAREVYDVLKFFSLPDGSLLYANATDWNLHQIAHTWNLHTLLERLAQDRQAGALASSALETLERMQARNPDGRIYAPGEYTSYPNFEAHAGVLIATGLMVAKMWPPPADAKPPETVWKELQGGRIFEDAHFFVMRTEKAVSSFAWGLRIMGLTIPFDKDPIVNPMNHSYIGIAADLGAETDRPARIGVGSLALERAIARDPVSIRTVISGAESGALHATASARHGALNQVFSFTALPSGKSVYMERFTGEGGPVHAGVISLLEEPAWVYGRAERRIERGEPGWVNVDNRLGFVVSGGGVRVARDYHNQLMALDESPRTNHVAIVITLPNFTASDTRAFASQMFRVAVKPPDIAAAFVDGFLVASNFSPHPTSAEVEVNGRAVSVPINGFATRVVRLN